MESLERVIVSSEVSRRAHRELYHCAEEAYRMVNGDILEAVKDFSGDFRRLHIASTWKDLLKLVSWTSDPRIGDLFLILKNIGVKTEELLPFRESDIGDIFPWLYYGKRFDALRKLCQIAKTNAERHLKNRDTRVYTHLVAEDLGNIVASSL
ncbi:MAG TPA: hypothetical protein VFG09_00705 [Thermodesulfovibrionales bacterium]|nr:hypothetical protein [Thermodesulfovibrionales bacterium]